LAFLGLEELLLADEVGVVVAGPAGQLAAVQFEDAVGHPAEEGAVVGDEEQGSATLEQEFLHPEDGIEVHVVGRFVQQQQAGVACQRAGEQAASLESA
jgi:hypothetical protein